MIGLPQLVDKLEQRLKVALPGTSAHEVMRAVPIHVMLPQFNHKLPPKPGAVLILLYEEDGIIKFPLTKRQTYVGAHSGQISFPGGKREKDESIVINALREAEEEIGISRNEVTVIGLLSEFFVIPSNFMVTPVVAYCQRKPTFIPDPREVNKVVEGDLAELITDDAVKRKEITVTSQLQMEAPHFLIDNEIVWGATAMMLNEFRVVVKDLLGTSAKLPS